MKRFEAEVTVCSNGAVTLTAASSKDLRGIQLGDRYAVALVPMETAESEPAALPFPPGDVPVKDLAARLSDIDDVEALHRLQRADTRTSAAEHYERRIRELSDDTE